MNIPKAEAFSNLRSLVLTRSPSPTRGARSISTPLIERLQGTVERVLSGKADVKELLRNRPKPVLPSRKAAIAARVSFNSEASGAATLIEIVAEDRPGLLYDLATAISANGCNIEVVLIDTQAHKAIDVFYVTADRETNPRQAAIRVAVETAAGVAGG